jgi:hypothetical protein
MRTHYALWAPEERQSILSPRLRYSPWIGVGVSSSCGIGRILARDPSFSWLDTRRGTRGDHHEAPIQSSSSSVSACE